MNEGDRMSTRVAINGFGRIGRAVLRSAIERNAELDIIAVNVVADADALAHLLTLDSVYGRFAHRVPTDNGALVVAGRRIDVLAQPDPGALLPWDALGADVVIDATGRFRTRADAARHIEAGARKVILSAPAKGSEPVDVRSRPGTVAIKRQVEGVGRTPAVS
jgi:glyceraldehyde 3-phosphate dehydrogenase